MIIENQEFIKELGESNTLKINNTTYNHSKLLEELLELSEVLIKMINKTENKQPKQEKLVEEVGDVLLRLEVLIIRENIQEEVSKRINNKIKQLDTWRTEGKYKTGL